MKFHPRPLTLEVTEKVVTDLVPQKILGPDEITGNFYQTFKE